MSNPPCRACDGFLVATLTDDVYECANCGLQRDFSDITDMKEDK